MELEKNLKTRNLLRYLLRLEDRVVGVPFSKMKRIRQITVSHCGPAVLEELFSFLGVKISQTAVVRFLRAGVRIKKLGLNIRQMARAANGLGKKEFIFWKKRGSTAADLSLIVNKYKYPVGVEWQGIFYEDADEDNGHYAVVTKIDIKADYLRVCDSYPKFYGVDRRLRLRDFVKRWWDENVINGRNVVDRKMTFVITPKGEIWPKKLGMKKA